MGRTFSWEDFLAYAAGFLLCVGALLAGPGTCREEVAPVSTAAEAIVRKQAIRQARAWLDEQPDRLDRFREALEAGDVAGLSGMLAEAGEAVYLGRLVRGSRGLSDEQREGWLEEARRVAEAPPPTAAYKAMREAELHYRALRVSPQLYRSCQPRPQHLEELTEVRTVVNLRRESEASRAMCARLGLEYRHLPVEDESVPRVEQLEEFLSYFDQPKLPPILVHCLAGKGARGCS